MNEELDDTTSNLHTNLCQQKLIDEFNNLEKITTNSLSIDAFKIVKFLFNLAFISTDLNDIEQV